MFLPDDYKVPSNSEYMKLKQGENSFRVLSSAIVGWEYWTNDNKPVRSKTQFKATPNIKIIDGKTSIKHFWAFAVWNYGDSKIQILEVVQSSIQNAIKSLVENKKWGDPKNYDLTITRQGEGFDTEYSVMPNPATALDESIVKEFQDKNINLEALFEGKNPFEQMVNTEEVGF